MGDHHGEDRMQYECMPPSPAAFSIGDWAGFVNNFVGFDVGHVQRKAGFYWDVTTDGEVEVTAQGTYCVNF